MDEAGWLARMVLLEDGGREGHKCSILQWRNLAGGQDKQGTIGTRVRQVPWRR